MAGGGFVGRSYELDVVQDALRAAASGDGGVVLVTGEAGIGKTRLVQAVAALAAGHGFTVSWGHCWETGAPAYWPWRQVLRAHAATASLPDLQQRLDPILPLLTLVAPELAPKTGPVSSSTEVESHGARFALFDAVATFLALLAQRHPQLVVLEDLHAANPSSIALLRFLQQEAARCPLLVVGTYREIEARLEPEVDAALADVGPAVRLRLAGLGDDDLALVVKRTAGEEVPADALSALRELTGGNPLFAEEVVRLLVAERRLTSLTAHAVLPVPSSARAVIRRRLEHVGSVARRVADAASVLGERVSVPLLQRLTGLADHELVAALAELTTIELLQATAEPMSYRFRHALVHEAVYEELEAPSRRALHLAAADAIEAAHTADLGPQLSSLSHHLVQALPLGGAERAVACLRASAEQTVRSFAYREAASTLELALELSESAAMPAEERAEILLALGDALRRDGDLAGALPAFREVAAIGRSLQRPALLARAALGYGSRLGGYVDSGATDHDLVTMLEDALVALPATPSPLRARVLARLAIELLWMPGADHRRAELTGEAVAMARELGDDALLAEALVARRIVGLGVLDPRECDEVLDELLPLAARAGDHECRMMATHAEIVDALSRGERARLEAAVARYGAGAEQLRVPSLRYWSMVFDTMLHLVDGRFDAAEQAILDSTEFGARYRARVADAFFWILYGQVWRTRLRDDDLANVLQAAMAATREHPTVSPWRPAVAFALALRGDVAGARRWCDEIVARLDELPRDYNRLSSLCILADAVSLLDAETHARRLYDELAPFAGRHAVIGQAMAVYGPVDRSLAGMARLLRDYDLAERHLERAVALEEGLGSEPALAWTLLERARLAADRGGQGAARAVELDRARADEITSRLGIGFFRVAFEGLLRDRVGKCSRVSIRRDGEYWSVGDGRRSFLLKDSKGLQYLAELTERPGREVHVLDLVAARCRPIAASDGAAPANDDLGPVLDAAAKAAYRRRWEELRAEVDEAEADNDPARAERAQAEIALLAAELSRAVGLGGRDRRPGSASERARVNATRALRSAIERIAQQDEDLGRHLDVSVKTGTYCSYAPRR